MKSWCAECMVAKKKAVDAKRRDDEEYHNCVLEQDMLHLELEAQAKRRRDEQARLCQVENMEYANQARQRRENEMEADIKAQRCPLVTEDTKLARNVNSEQWYRRDHFKGFSKEQVAQLYRENESVAEDRLKQKAREAESEADWAWHQEEMLSKMREVEETRHQMLNEERRIHLDVLARQNEELNKRKAQMKAERLPEIGTAYFSRFGRSSR